MNVYILKSNMHIYPYMDSIRDVLVSNKTLSQIQTQSVQKAGCRPIWVDSFDQINDDQPHIVFYDNLMISEQALRNVLRMAANEKEGFKCAVEDAFYIHSYLWHIKENDGAAVPLQLYYLTGRETIPVRLVTLPFQCKVFDADRMPSTMKVDRNGFKRPLTDVIIIPIQNWVNLWQANLSVIMKLIYESMYTKPLRQIIRYVKCFGKIHKMYKLNNVIGKNCYIHPSAIVEGSILGDNVHIGANAVVRFSIIGDGAHIDDQAMVRLSVIGDGVYIHNNTCLIFTVVYPGSFLITGPYQYSLIGRDCCIMGCYNCDVRLDKNTIRADIGGSILVDTNQIYLGCCYGHEVRMGAGTILLPGRAVPNNLRINANPSNFITGF